MPAASGAAVVTPARQSPALSPEGLEILAFRFRRWLTRSGSDPRCAGRDGAAAPAGFGRRCCKTCLT